MLANRIYRMIDNRQKKLEEIKNKPDNRFCSCGLEKEEIFTCKHKSCQEQRLDDVRINKLVESGWLPIERWRHT